MTGGDWISATNPVFVTLYTVTTFCKMFIIAKKEKNAPIFHFKLLQLLLVGHKIIICLRACVP